MLKDTIVAISTPLGTGGISVIRISGNQALANISKIFKSTKKINLLNVKTHTIHHGFILNDKKEILDEVLISIFKKPNSFTGDDVVEISGHGGILITQILLERVLSLNIRLAQPGEFSKRAFLNGKIDLIQADAIMDLIHAKNQKAVKLSQIGLQKKNSQLINNLNQKILTLIGQIEVNIDYPEYEDTLTMENNIILPAIKNLIIKMEEILDNSEKTIFFKEGVKTLIIGKPNVGKSSLLNVFLNETRSMVSDIAGTTRDFIDVFFNIKDLTLLLVDTAGIRETEDPLEKIGVLNSQKILKEAELVLLLLDQSQPLDKDDFAILETTKKYPRIIVGNKMDLPCKINSVTIKKEILFISTKTQEGIENLKENIYNLFKFDLIEKKDFNYFSNIRHIKQIKIALTALKNIKKDIKNKMPVDIHTINLKEAYKALGEIIGYNTDEHLINELFSKFCLGK